MAKSLVFNPFSGNFDIIDQVTLAAVGSTPNANGATASANVLTLQPASASFPGVITTGSQTIAGSKTLTGLTYADGGIDTSAVGTLAFGTTNANIINIGNSGATINIQGSVLYENVTQLQVTDPLITINKGGGTGSGSNSGIEIEENSIITAYAETSADRNSWILKAPNTAGIATITAGVSGITLAGNVSGNNTGDVTIGTANGLSLVGQALSLGLSSASTTGALSSADFNTFNGKQAAGNYITALTGDVVATGPGSVASTIQANVVSNSKLAQIPARSYKGNNTGSPANAADITSTQLTADLDLFTSSLQGLVPASGGGTSNFLRADGTFAVPAGISPLTTKGDLYTYSTVGARLPVGTYGQSLTSDSGQTTGLRWDSRSKGPKNYIVYTDFENSATTGYSLGNVTVTSGLPTGVPTFGSGASGNLSLSVVTTNPLSGIASLGYVSSAATTAGNFVATNALSLDISDQAKVLAFKLYYSAASGATNANFSGTSSNSFGVAIYDITNSAWIIPAGVFNFVQNSGVGIAQGTFQTPVNMTSFRVVLYNATATTGAITMVLDDFYVGPQALAFGPAMSDVQSFTPTLPVSIGNGTSYGKWRRVGDKMEIEIGFNSGTTTTYGGANWSFPLPAGFVIDAAKIADTVNISTPVGTAQVKDTASPNFYSGVTVVRSSTSLSVAPTGAANASLFGPSVPFAFAAGTANQSLVFNALVPIVGWSSNTVMSADSSTRVISATAVMQTNQGVAAAGTIKYDTILADTSGSYSTSTGLYTVPVTGLYQVSITSQVSAISSINITINGVAKGYFLTNPNGTYITSGSLTVPVKAGDQIGILTDTSITVSGVAGANYLNTVSFTRISGPAVVAASESVNLGYNSASGSVNSSDSLVPYSSKDFDTHNAYSSGVYTVPVTGKYFVSASVRLSGTFVIGNENNLMIYQNGASKIANLQRTSANNLDVAVSGLISAVAGDTIRIFVNSGGTGVSIASDATHNKLSIFRAGN